MQPHHTLVSWFIVYYSMFYNYFFLHLQYFFEYYYSTCNQIRSIVHVNRVIAPYKASIIFKEKGVLKPAPTLILASKGEKQQNTLYSLKFVVMKFHHFSHIIPQDTS